MPRTTEKKKKEKKEREAEYVICLWSQHVRRLWQKDHEFEVNLGFIIW
jgi:hypothetical protein